MKEPSHSSKRVNAAAIQFQRLEEMLVPTTDFKGEYKGVIYKFEKRIREHYKDSNKV